MSLIYRIAGCLALNAVSACAAPASQSFAYFEPNRGQADPAAVFLARTPGYTILLGRDAAVSCYLPSAGGSVAPVRMELIGGRPAIEIEGRQPLPSVTRYYAGHAREHAAVPHYRGLRARDVYRGIDMLWRTRGSGLEYDFLVKPGADSGRIQLRFRGARRIWIDRRGALIVRTRNGKLRHRRPRAWQVLEGRRVIVGARFRLDRDIAGFELGRYDRSRTLWIDPVLSYSTYLGGDGYDAAYAVAAGSDGRSYVTGVTTSVRFSSGTGERPDRDAFVTKFNGDGSVAYTTILSSSSDDYGYAIAVDPAGSAYVAGSTAGADFPATPGAWQSVSGGNEDAFAARLDPDGNLVYASYIGGTEDDSANGIALDPNGNAYVAGYTASSGFPTTVGAPQAVHRGGQFDAFIVKLNPAGSAAAYSTLLGGTGNDQALAIATGAGGNACIAGYSDSTDLPVQGAFQASSSGQGDGIVACLNAAGDAWTIVSYLGGSGYDEVDALALDAFGNLYLAGTTFSWDFPVTAGAFQASPAGGYDAFVVKLSPAGSLVYATLLGGGLSDAATALTAGAGDVWVVGYTRSADLPLAGAAQSFNRGGFEGFFAHLSADGSTLLASSYLGGSQDDQVWGVAADSAGRILVAGSTASQDFPVTSGAAGPAASGDENAFLSRIDPALAAFAISGQVTVSGVASLSGLTVTLSGAVNRSATTDVSGNYRFTSLPAGGSYTVTPSGGSYSFSPPSQDFSNLSADQAASFTATCPLTVSPATVYLDSASQAGPPLFVTAPSDCLWVASPEADFINLASGTNGMGNGAITFSVPPNNTGLGLSGQLQVDGQSVSVTQRATVATFSDVALPDFYFDGANVLYARAITGGCAANPLRYCPNDNITRGQMAVFIVASIEGKDPFAYTTTPYFSDVPVTHPFFKFIQKLRDLGVTSGCSANRFCPDDPVTRGQMAVFIIAARYGAVPYSYPSTPYFTDVPPASPFFGFVQKMAQVGITAGCGPGVYCPGATLTRGQMAVFIAAGLLNQLPAGTPVVTSAAPASAARGQAVTAAITAKGTHFVQGATQVWTAPGITPSNINVTGPAGLTLQLAVNPGAALGPSSIVVTTGSEEAVLPNGFQVR